MEFGKRFAQASALTATLAMAAIVGNAQANPLPPKSVAAARGADVSAIPTTLSAAEMTGSHRHARGVDPSTSRVRPRIVINDPALSASQPDHELAARALAAILCGQLCRQRLRRCARNERGLDHAAVVEVEPRTQQQLLAGLTPRPPARQHAGHFLLRREHPPPWAGRSWPIPAGWVPGKCCPPPKDEGCCLLFLNCYELS